MKTTPKKQKAESRKQKFRPQRRGVFLFLLSQFLPFPRGISPRRFLLPLILLFHGVNTFAFAGYLQPFVYYGIDQTGAPLTNAITIGPPPTLAGTIVALNTNIVAITAHTYQPDANGFVSNSIAPGNYSLQIAGYHMVLPFGIVSNAAPQNLSQVAGIPVVTFINFTLAQFSDAGTMARENTNNWTRNSYQGVTNAAGFPPATNGGSLAVSQLPYTPATNGGSVAVSQLPYTPATNGGTIAYSQLPWTPPTNTPAGIKFAEGFQPATNNPNTNVLVYISGVTGITNASGVVTNLTLSFATNTINYQQR